MRIDKFGQQIFTEEELCDSYLRNTSISLKNLYIDNEINFGADLELEHVPTLIKYLESDLSIEEFDKLNQQKWYMPKEYLEMDIAKHILDKCNGEVELQRAGKELLMYQEKNMFDLLRYLKYFVDSMKKNNIVLGVGRGSSVASFVLFLLEVHRINSLYFDLPIEEFLKKGETNV